MTAVGTRTIRCIRRFTSSTLSSSSSSSFTTRGPLHGIRILDLSRILAAPFATQILGDMGAQVWKVEHPGQGDDTRGWGPPFVKPKEKERRKELTGKVATIAPSSSSSTTSPASESSYFLSCNRNKSSLAINLKSPLGIKLIHRLVKHADILVENFAPGKMDELGLGYEGLSKINPSLIYASISGYGESGPLSSQPGYDVMASARGGLMHITGSEKEPSKVGVAITDVSTGLVLHGAILAALFERERNPQRLGQKISTNLLEVQVACLVNIGQNYHSDHKMVGQRRNGSAHESIVPYQAFSCRADDALNTPASLSSSVTAASTSSSSSSPSPPSSTSATAHFVCGALNPRQYTSLCAAMSELSTSITPPLDISFLSRPDFSTNALRVKNRTEFITHLQSLFSHFTKSTLISLMQKYELPASPINNIAEVFQDEQVKYSRIVKEVEHTTLGEMNVTGNPIHFSRTPTAISLPPPVLGEHTYEVLREVLGVKEEELRKLEGEGVIKNWRG